MIKPFILETLLTVGMLDFVGWTVSSFLQVIISRLPQNSKKSLIIPIRILETLLTVGMLEFVGWTVPSFLRVLCYVRPTECRRPPLMAVGRSKNLGGMGDNY